MPSLLNNKVLIVDDVSSNLFILNAMLRNLNVECEKAPNGKIAYEMFKREEYGLVLMDINMPIMNGIESSYMISQYCAKKNI